MVGYIEHHAEYLNPMIRHKLISDEYSADLIAEIASSPDILKSLMESPVHESLALIGEMRAQYKFQNKPAQTEVKPVRTPSIPNGNVANGNKRIPPGVSMSEYKRLRSLGYT